MTATANAKMNNPFSPLKPPERLSVFPRKKPTETRLNVTPHSGARPDDASDTGGVRPPLVQGRPAADVPSPAHPAPLALAVVGTSLVTSVATALQA